MIFFLLLFLVRENQRTSEKTEERMRKKHKTQWKAIETIKKTLNKRKGRKSGKKRVSASGSNLIQSKSYLIESCVHPIKKIEDASSERKRSSTRRRTMSILLSSKFSAIKSGEEKIPFSRQKAIVCLRVKRDKRKSTRYFRLPLLLSILLGPLAFAWSEKLCERY